MHVRAAKHTAASIRTIPCRKAKVHSYSRRGRQGSASGKFSPRARMCPGRSRITSRKPPGPHSIPHLRHSARRRRTIDAEHRERQHCSLRSLLERTRARRCRFMALAAPRDVRVRIDLLVIRLAGRPGAPD